jgi:NAD dependent epimerase/dehydratase
MLLSFCTLNWTGRKVLVTGAGGFIGSHLCERLVGEEARVRAFVHYNARGSAGWLDRSPRRADIEILPGNICDRDSVVAACAGVDTIFHLAALIGIPYSYAAPQSYVDTNLTGSLNVFQAARAAGVRRLVHTSTSETYGSAQYVPIDEKHPMVGQSPYSASKIAADMMAEAFHRSFELPVATIRPFNTFGPRQSARAVIPTIITQALVGTEIRLGNLDSIRDFNYVADTVEGFLTVASADAALGRVVNIATSSEIAVREVVERVLKQLGKQLPVVEEIRRKRPERSEVDRLCGANGLAHQLTGWEPRVPFADGLARTIDWIRDNLADVKADGYAV